MNLVLYSMIIVFGFGLSEQLQLKYVHVIFRHGDRAPIKIYPNNPNNEKVWKFGLGQLTDIGIKQHFILGRWLRTRYNDFLKQEYDHNEILVNSTNVDRTLMSAQANLAGLYYNEHSHIIPYLNWRPIPVHIFPHSSEIDMLSFNCNLYYQKRDEMYKTQYYKSLFAEFQPTLDFLKNITNNQELTLVESMDVFDTFACEKAHGIAMDPRVTEEIYSEMSSMDMMNWKMVYYGDKLAQLSGGLFLNEIVKKMEKMAKTGHLHSEKLQIYSAHDTSIAGLMAAIGIFEGIQPPYASCLIIELYHAPENNLDFLQNWIVKIFYKTKYTYSQTELQEIELKFCKSKPCTLREFIESVRPRLLNKKTYKKMCFHQDFNNSY